MLQCVDELVDDAGAGLVLELIGGDGVAQVPQDAGTLHRVGLDHRVFFGGQAAGLVEDLSGDHDLAQVVQGRCRADERNVALVQLIPVGLARQLVQQ